MVSKCGSWSQGGPKWSFWTILDLILEPRGVQSGHFGQFWTSFWSFCGHFGRFRVSFDLPVLPVCCCRSASLPVCQSAVAGLPVCCSVVFQISGHRNADGWSGHGGGKAEGKWIIYSHQFYRCSACYWFSPPDVCVRRVFAKLC